MSEDEQKCIAWLLDERWSRQGKGTSFVIGYRISADELRRQIGLLDDAPEPTISRDGTSCG